MCKLLTFALIALAIVGCKTPPPEEIEESPAALIADSTPSLIDVARDRSKGITPEREHLGWSIYTIEGGFYGKKADGSEFRADVITTDDDGITLRGYPEFRLASERIPFLFKSNSKVDAATNTFRINGD